MTTRERRFVVWGRDGTSGYREQTLASIKQLYTNYRFYGVSAEQRFPAPEKTAGD